MKDRLIKIHRVTKVVKGGRIFSYTSTSICGNKKNLIGFGRGKSKEVLESIKKSYLKSRNNIFKINIKKETIPYCLYAKHSATKIILIPASKIIGLIANFIVKQVLMFSGIKSIFSKIHGSHNSINTTICVIKALNYLK
ncbi:30S ribosomal protein S5 [Candidatus Carsonella ruddii]|uniref:Small ribosomal subunit protein uS5 n=1 Tax=Candidatus Carsonella ruddii HC isolate Thao2000 TaxID=1202538 RepID=J3YQ63_CARRU|nr:30S ribosomal protein S5 [Candidatus Carsonella ruddii]AFP84008.1 ribosomal protein S5 [Candidatus Carsonella ruddii HC isolate Thao2000]